MNLESIELLTKEHAADRALVAERVQALNDEIEVIKRRRIAGLKSAVAKARDSRLRLSSAIEHHGKSLFDKPRTRVFHGIKVGLQKAKGKLSWTAADRVVELIRKHFPEQAETLIKTEEKPVKAALLNLPAGDLKRLGCTIADAGDKVIVEPISTEIDELVQVLLGEGDTEEGDDE